MKETGLIMSTPMMVADIQKRKFQTRRTWGLSDINIHPDDWQLVAVFQDGLARFYNKTIDAERTIKCPYGGVGDLVWCKESLKRKPDYSWCKEGYAVYAIDGEQVLIGGAGINEGVPWEWEASGLSSMFMPRWASRKSHILTNIRCERVQAITEDDAKDEGVGMDVWHGDKSEDLNQPPHDVKASYRTAYANLWDFLNGKKYPWDKNVWVFVLEWENE